MRYPAFLLQLPIQPGQIQLGNDPSLYAVLLDFALNAGPIRDRVAEAGIVGPVLVLTFAIHVDNTRTYESLVDSTNIHVSRFLTNIYSVLYV